MKKLLSITILDTTILEWIYTLLSALAALIMFWIMACFMLSF